MSIIIYHLIYKQIIKIKYLGIIFQDIHTKFIRYVILNKINTNCLFITQLDKNALIIISYNPGIHNIVFNVK